MNVELTKEQKAIRRSVRDFVEKEIIPRAERMDRDESIPDELLKKIADVGYFGVSIPAEYGGSDLDPVSNILLHLEMGRGCAGTATTVGASAGLFGGNVAANGTERQKEKYLPRIASGEWIGCMGLTEPGAGSDAFSIKTRAEKRKDRYVLNGSKTLISNAPIADVALIYATVDLSLGTKGLCAFIVEREFPGYTTGKKFEKMGLRASPTGEIILEDCEVPAENLICGVEGKGFGQMIRGLNVERIGWSAIAVGVARAAFEAGLRYAREREQFGQAIYEFQMVQGMIAEMASQVYLGELACLHSAALMKSGEQAALESSFCKLYTGEMVMRVASDAVQIHGGYGYMREFPVERYLRDAKVFAIGAGTSQVQKLIIAHQLRTHDFGQS